MYCSAIRAGVNRRAAARQQSAGSSRDAAPTAPASASSSPGSTSTPVRPSSTNSGRHPRRNPSTGVPSASDSTTAVPPGSSQSIGASESRAAATSASRSAPCTVPTQRTSRPSTSGSTSSRQYRTSGLSSSAVAPAQVVDVVVRPDGTGEHERGAGAVREPRGDGLPLHPGDPSHHHEVVPLRHTGPSVRPHGQRSGQVHVPDAACLQRRGGRAQLRGRDAVDPQ